MASYNRDVVAHYNLPQPFPTSWPAELDESEDEEPAQQAAVGVRRSRSRYSALERSASDRRSMLPGSQRTRDGRANLVQKDEPDPLGGMNTVIQSLKQRGLPVDDDSRVRNKFLLSSTTFSPAYFLSQTHPNASTEDLVQGLKYLTNSIDQKSASLKELVESNFERFVRAKATIDNVYTEMRNQGIEPDPYLSARHSRQVSRSSGHFRNFSSGSAAGMAAPSTKQTSKNALRKESEYGVQGIRAPLLEVSQKAEEVWGPALGGREREATLKAVAEAMEQDKSLYELGANMRRSIRQKEYQTVVQQYTEARTCVIQAKTLGDRAQSEGQVLTDPQIHKILVTGRMWADVEEQIKALKKAIWYRLSESTAQTLLPLPGASQAEEHMELISVLLELGVEDNPIWTWLLGRYDHLKTKIAAVAERSKIEIEILRRRLQSAEKPTKATITSYLRQAMKENPDGLDSEQVLEFWEAISMYMTKLLSLSSGLLGEVVDFWDSAQAFIDGHKQKQLPSGFEGQSRKHHRLSEAGVKDLRDGAVKLVGLIQGAANTLFADPPTEDISALFSPVSANTPKTPLSAVFSPTSGRLGNIDQSSVPAPSPKKGEGWEDFAFWPPHSNSLSAVQYLGKVLVLLGTAAGVMATMGPINSSNSMYEKLKAMVTGARERCTRAICDAWSKDSEHCKYLEDWTRSSTKHDQTRMPSLLFAFERNVLTGLQQVLYFSEAVNKPGARDIVTPPSSKLIQLVRSQFVGSIDKALNGMRENAETSPDADEDDWIWVTSAMAKSNLDSNAGSTSVAASDAIDGSSKTNRLLLTLSNVKALRMEHIPQLIAMFESSFSVKLTEESKSIRDACGQIDAKLFHSYTQPTVASLNKIIRDGIHAPDWVPKTNKPDQVSPYVYAVMMTLVTVHTEVSTTVTSPGENTSVLLNQALQYLLEKIAQAQLDAFKDRKPNSYTLPALMQATLDTEFIASSMTQYGTKTATDISSSIYTELDQRTNNESRAQLQMELGNMRVVLKKLREGSRASFGCFRTRESKDRGRPNRKATG
jgi:exocyst complex component 2